MASRTQIRLQQITGSFGNSSGKIRDDIGTAATLAVIKATDLTGSLGHLASAIKRINGGSAFTSTAAGVLDNTSTKIGSAAGSGKDLFMYTAGTAAHVGVQWDADGETEGILIGGADDHGVDLKFFGETSGKFMHWDMSGDELVLASSTKLSFHDAAGGENIVASADGHLEVNAGTTLDMTAPTVDINASTAVTIDSDAATFESSNANDPLVIIKNTTNDGDGARLRFVKDKGAAGADNDVAGLIEFYADDDNQDNILFAKIEAAVADASNGAEGGKLSLGVATHDGEFQFGLVLQDGDAEDEIDVTLGSGTSSLVTTTGGLTVTGDLTVNGTTTTVDTTNTLVKDKLLTLNDGGANNTARGAGIEFEENSAIAGFMKTSSTGEEFEFKVPEGGHTLTLDINADKEITVGGDLNIEANSVINQDLSTDSTTVQFGKVAIDSANDHFDVASSNLTATANQDFIIDATRHIILDADAQGEAGDTGVLFKDGGTLFGSVFKDGSNNLVLSGTAGAGVVVSGSSAQGGVVLNLIGGESGDALLGLMADQSDDDADVYRMGVLASGNSFVLQQFNGSGYSQLFSAASGGAAFNFGVDGADADVTMNFLANNNDGAFKWMEDEDYFEFSDDILMNGTEKIQFNDTGVFIHSNADGDLLLSSDGTNYDAIKLDSAGGIDLDADAATDGITYSDGGTKLLSIGNNAQDVFLKPLQSSKDLIFKNQAGRDILNVNEAGHVAIGNGDQSSGKIRLLEDSDNGTNYSEISVPAALAANYAFVLPGSNGTDGFALVTDGSGNTSWAAVGSDSIKRSIFAVTGTLAANTAVVLTGSNNNLILDKLDSSDEVSFSTTDTFASRGRKTEMYVNGQLLLSGSPAQVTAGSRDYVCTSATAVKFAFGLEVDDIIQVLTR